MRLNHVLLRTPDLDASLRFWVDVVGLTVGERPAFPFAGAWLYSEGRAVIHLMVDATLSGGPPGLDHVAFDGADYGAVVRRLHALRVAHQNQHVPGTGMRQVFAMSPEGVAVEWMFEPARSAVTAH